MVPEDDHTVLGRLMTIVDVVLDSDGPLMLADLTKLAGLPKPTVRRMANSLVHRSLLTLTRDGYSSGPGLVELGSRAAEQQSRRRVAAPYLQDLYERTRAVIWLVDVRPEKHWTIVASVFDHAAMPYSENWPRNASDPAVLTSALGQLVLSRQLDRAENLLAAGIPRTTPYTRSRRGQVIGALRRAEGEKRAVEHDQVRSGWSCLATPIEQTGDYQTILGVVNRTPRFNTGRPVAAAEATARQIDHEWSFAGL